jgi:hypothetical protein
LNREAAKIVAIAAAPFLALKLIGFIGASASTLGVLTFFFFESLVPYRWALIIGGTALSALAMFAEAAYSKRVLAKQDDADTG